MISDQPPPEVVLLYKFLSEPILSHSAPDAPVGLIVFTIKDVFQTPFVVVGTTTLFCHKPPFLTEAFTKDELYKVLFGVEW